METEKIQGNLASLSKSKEAEAGLPTPTLHCSPWAPFFLIS